MQPGAWNIVCSEPLGKVLVAADVAIKGMATRAAGLRADAIRILVGTAVAFAVAAVLCVTGLLLARRRVALPLRDIMVPLNRLAVRDYAMPVAQPRRSDEFRVMAQTLEQLRQGAVEGERLAAERLADQAARVERAAKLDGRVKEFEAKVSAMVGMLSSGATELEATAQSMSSTATADQQQATTVAAAAEEATAGLQTVAAAAEELTASIGEIGRQVAQSSKITGQAVDDAKRTDEIVRTLSDGAEKIGPWSA